MEASSVELAIIDLIQDLSSNDRRERVSPDTHLIKTGILDSLAVVELASKIEAHFAVKLDSRVVNPSYFATVRQLSSLVPK